MTPEQHLEIRVRQLEHLCRELQDQIDTLAEIGHAMEGGVVELGDGLLKVEALVATLVGDSTIEGADAPASGSALPEGSVTIIEIAERPRGELVAWLADRGVGYHLDSFSRMGLVWLVASDVDARPVCAAGNMSLERFDDDPEKLPNLAGWQLPIVPDPWAAP
jgi:hypothetical protein